MTAVRKVVAAAVGLVVLVVLLAGAAGAGVTSILGLGTATAATPSATAAGDIPAGYQALYVQAASTCPGLPWPILAAIGKVETDHGRSPSLTSTAGAQGPMQFLPATFAEYAVDADRGGADIDDPADAIYTAARMLCADGARGGAAIPAAIYAYNHDQAYVTRVLTIAATYTAASPDPAAGTAAETSPAALVAVDYATAQLGLPYQWGGNGPDHGDPGFDCSGLTHNAYAAAGITLPRTAQTQYDRGPHLPADATLQPGDLLFYGTPSDVHHVGIFIGNGQMIDAPTSGALVRREPYHWSDYLGATRPAAA